MSEEKKAGIMVGVLFIVATLAGVLCVLTLQPILNVPEYLAQIAANQSQFILAGLLQVIMAAACAAIAIWLYPLLRKRDETLALAAVGFRGMEGVIFMVAAAVQLSLLTVSRAFTTAGPAQVAHIQLVGDAVKAVSDQLFTGVGAIAFCLGAIMYYVVFYRSKLIPRWLSIWGLIAIAMHLLYVILMLFGHDSFLTSSFVLNLPIFLQEMVMAVWLIVKGFNQPAPAADPAR